MQAIILAAGMGKRLKKLTRDNTKCMVEVNGVPLINRTLCELDKKQLSKIIIVVGYEAENLINHINTLSLNTPIVFIENPIYDKTNNIYSLSLAKEYLLSEDSLLLESDIIFESAVLDCLIEDPRPSLALVAEYEPWMDGTCVRLSNEDDITQIISGSKFQFTDISGCYKTVNLYKFSREFSRSLYVPFLEAYTKALGNNEYYEQVLKVLVALDDPGIKAKRLKKGLRWYEIDDIQDLDIAESLFAPEEERLSLLNRRYGGYWRYPDMLDFCYLVNCYYPPKKMLDELRASFDTLICGYPSGMYVNTLLAARNFSLRQDQIVVGNGAAELIKLLLDNTEGRLGIIRPTFEEYANRYPADRLITYCPDNDSFSYTADDLVSYFENTGIQNLVLINPDNPSGNYIRKKDMMGLVGWAKQKGIHLIIDESFVDFSSEPDASLLEEDFLDANPHLTVIKSISKSYGIPGLRLGIAASGNADRITRIKHEVSIWNINSVGEFYMQIAGKYKKDYVNSLALLRKERERLTAMLGTIPALRVIPSEANYLMAELVGCADAATALTSTQLATELLTRHNLLIKDLSPKLNGRSFIRIAVRNEKDDDYLCHALREILMP